MTRACALLLVLAISGCHGIRGVGCHYPDSELAEAAASFADAVPAAEGVLARTEVFCVAVGGDTGYVRENGEKVAGETLWPGSDMAAARIRLAEGSVYPTALSGALPHEFLHLYLWDAAGDPCYDHTDSCGWDEGIVEHVRRSR